MREKTEDQTRASVVVVGGGPTGMFLATELALANVNVVVLERRPDPVAQARALSMQPRSIELLALRGMIDRFLDQGVKVPTGHYAALDSRLDFTRLDSSCPYGLLIPQNQTESLLEARAIELGADIRRGWLVESVREDNDGVTVRGIGIDGNFTINASYVVGADGARSLVRQQCGIGFPGTPTSMTFYFGDVFIERNSMPVDGRFQIRTAAGIMEGFPKSDGRHRIVFIDPERLHTPLTSPVTLEEMQQGASRIMGSDTTLRDPTWMSRFGNETRLADRYRSGRIFLAGDSAHIHLPAGGQGMNTGLQDAMNLGWKLAAAINCWAPDSLLDSYDAERRPVGRQLIENTKAQGALIKTLMRDGDALWNAFNALLDIPATNLHVATMITALDTVYPAPLAEIVSTPANQWTGRRLRDTTLRMDDGTEVTLYSLLRAGEWVYLTLDRDNVPPPEFSIPTDRLRALAVTVIDAGSELRRLNSVLVRPDGHIAYAV